jgi:hypothetical protein
MTPDQIKQYIAAHYPTIVSKRRRRPHGWSFYYGEVLRGPNSTRIARVVDSTEMGNEFKLSVTSRLTNTDAVCHVASEEQLQSLLEQELKLWKESLVI